MFKQKRFNRREDDLALDEALSAGEAWQTVGNVSRVCFPYRKFRTYHRNPILSIQAPVSLEMLVLSVHA